MIIGNFTASPHNDILEGTIVSPYGEISASLYPTDDKDTLPEHVSAKGVDYILMSERGAELGVGWKKTAKDGKAYVSIRMDGFGLPAPIDCALFQFKGCHHVLVWRRDDRKQD